MVVPIELINAGVTPSYYFIRKMMIVLEKQGQIEPLQVYTKNGRYYTFDEDPYGAEFVHAARRLGWESMLITVAKRYTE